MSRRIRVGLIFGGASVEHEVSVVSARGVLSGFDPERFECVPIGVTEDGRWLGPEASEAVVRGDAPRVEVPVGEGPGCLRVDPGRGLVRAEGGDLRPLDLDIVFPLIHGWGGEDGRLQGLLELIDLPYVGAGVLGSALGMDKEISRIVFERRGLPVCRWAAFTSTEYGSDPESVRKRLMDAPGLPLFVKPANGGSSVGVSKVVEPGSLAGAIDDALACDGKVVVEQAIDAREIECAVLGNDAPEASVLGEIVPSREFYDYAAKYEDGTSELIIPAPFADAEAEEIRRLALEAFRALDLSGLARVDFLVERDTGQARLNEVNTLPGFTPISMFPKLWEASGVPYPELLDRLIRLGLERWADVKNRVTRRRS